MNPKKLNVIAFSWILVLLLVLKLMVLFLFNYHFIDGDQVMMWEALENYSKGFFHEPRFYGQAYNTMLESFLAIPFHWAGMKPQHSLPLVSNILALIPFIYFSILCLRYERPQFACLTLLLPICMPVEYDMIASLPRGFVTGLAVASFGAAIVFEPDRKSLFFFLPFVSVLGFGFNPNSVLLSFPLCFYAFLRHFRNPVFYKYAIAGTLIAAVPVVLADYFYILHPEYVVHRMPKMEFSMRWFNEAFNELDKHIGDLVPLFWHKSLFLICLIAGLLTALIWRKKYRADFAFALAVLMLVFTFGLSKVHDGTNNIFFHYNRMYLGLPLLLLMFAVMLRGRPHWYWSVLMMLIAPVYLFLKYETMQRIIENPHTRENFVVPVRTQAALDRTCGTYDSLAAKDQAELILVTEHCDEFFVIYGCASCRESFPPAIWPSRDRRHWRMLEEENKVYDRILILDQSYNFVVNSRAKGMKVHSYPWHPECYLLVDNRYTMKELWTLLELKVRPY